MIIADHIPSSSTGSHKTQNGKLQAAQVKESLSKSVNRILKLKVITFKVVSATNTYHFEVTLKEIAQLARKEFKRGSDIRITFLEKKI